MDNDISSIQELCLQMIIAAGDAKASFIGALRAAAKSDSVEADRLYEEGVDRMNETHQYEAELMTMFSQNVNAVSVDLLLVHANDHMSMALCSQELCNEMRPIVEMVYELKRKLE